MNSICNGATSPPLGEAPTLTVAVVVVVDAIEMLSPAYGSVDLGYACSVEFRSCVHVNIIESVKQGDILTLNKNDTISGTITQDPRTIYNITTSDKVETNLYTGLGISTAPRPISWTKQKVDKSIAGVDVSKARDSLEPLVYPTARIISDLYKSGTELFVYNASLFNY